MLRYFAFSKPFQVLSQFSAEGSKQTLKDFFPADLPKDIYPVGRLDYDSEGLLILTNDKQLTHRLLEPKFKHKRTYWVQVEGMPTTDALNQLRNGIFISINGKQHFTAPAEVRLFNDPPEVPDRDPPIRFRKSVPDSWVSLTLTEGKNRQVRRMTAAVGLPTLRLIRYSIGSITLDGLSPGSYRELSNGEHMLLFSDS